MGKIANREVKVLVTSSHSLLPLPEIHFHKGPEEGCDIIHSFSYRAKF